MNVQLELDKLQCQSDHRAKFCTTHTNRFQKTDEKRAASVKVRTAKPMQSPSQMLKQQGINPVEKASRCSMCLSITLTTPSGGSMKHAVLLNSDTTVDCISYELASQLDWNQLEALMEIIEILNGAEADWYGIYEAQLTMTDSLRTTKVVR